MLSNANPNKTSLARLLYPTYSFAVFCRSKFEFWGEICCLMAATTSEGFKMNLSHTRKGSQILVSLGLLRTPLLFLCLNDVVLICVSHRSFLFVFNAQLSRFAQI